MTLTRDAWLQCRHDPQVIIIMLRFVAALLLALTAILEPVDAEPVAPHPSLRFGAVLFQDDFRSGLSQWQIETERPGKIVANNGVLDIDIPAGATLWFKPQLTGPVAIVFDARAISAGGRNDRVSDLSCFWMARNQDDKSPVYERRRSGKFDDYNDLLTYYVGLGASNNTTTRFRRYAGSAVSLPLLPEHDLTSPDVLLAPNRTQTVTVLANGHEIEYWRDSKRLIRFVDPEPYTRGWFALRTTQSHLKIESLRVYSLH